jgi:hypothetical protein
MSTNNTVQSHETGALDDHELDQVAGGLKAGAQALGQLIYKLIAGDSGSDNSSYGMCYDR